ncbi:hypothetical protein [Haloechinothrix sp. LS1_15]|uniref:hypothetical protein n=1 Tax=Haloechinothrix sp. LS1_15 TaxID=2652248 RepID=UPI00294424BB|nr:hypothetical protein [Haloechinothrix sp. LS1_15]MDV6011436.1 hypothetical protein [Haloechinothrix sp. LS1_15]
MPESGSIDRLDELASQVVAEEPVWGQWWVAQTLRHWPDARDLLRQHVDMSAMRLDRDDSQRWIAEVAAMLEVAQLADVPLAAERRQRLLDELPQRVDEVSRPYAQCRALDAAAILDDGRDWTTGIEVPPVPEVHDLSSMMNLYGALCVERHVTGQVAPTRAADARQLVSPVLDDPADLDDPLVGFASRVWLEASGDTAALSGLVGQSADRIDDESGLLRKRVHAFGTLRTTYLVAWLASYAQAAEEILGPETREAVREEINEARRRGADLDVAYGATTLLQVDDVDDELRAEASATLRRKLEGPLFREQLDSVWMLVNMLQQLGGEVPQLHVPEPFPVRDDEDRYQAWTLLGLRPFVAQEKQERITEYYRDLLDDTPDLLRAGYEELTLRELLAGVAAIAGDLPQSEYNALLDDAYTWTTELRGCQGFTRLYRPDRGTSECGLATTALVIREGLDHR